MGEWYWIGLLVGVGAGFGVLFTGVLSTVRGGVVAAILLAAAAGVALGFALEDWDEALGGGLGGVAGVLGAAQVVRGALRLLVDVDRDHAEPRPLLAREVREQALHPPGGARLRREEEDEQRPSVSQDSS